MDSVHKKVINALSLEKNRLLFASREINNIIFQCWNDVGPETKSKLIKARKELESCIFIIDMHLFKIDGAKDLEMLSKV